ncbi:MAG: hypothetical protein JJE22_09645 [Bacteroidia bacterium]|nr:hypothetical protein [Bacteroidia bacterium]
MSYFCNPALVKALAGKKQSSLYKYAEVALPIIIGMVEHPDFIGTKVGVAG